jgi:hypothetical protein
MPSSIVTSLKEACIRDIIRKDRVNDIVLQDLKDEINIYKQQDEFLRHELQDAALTCLREALCGDSFGEFGVRLPDNALQRVEVRVC